MKLLDELAQQRWDDHRYYHHNRINQSLHVVSACCFLATYALVFTSPVAAAFTGWILAMTSRQVGHFFFEPRDYDQANKASHEHKESIKVGYNLNRKRVLLALWAISPLALYLQPAMFGLFEPHASLGEYANNLALLWIYLGIAAVLFRTVQLFIQSNIVTGLAWFTKIVTDPFHDIKLYHKAPIHVLRGDLYDPIVTDSEGVDAR